MIEIENRPELGAERDTFLAARWIIKRLHAEQAFYSFCCNPETPVTMFEDLNWEINMLNNFLPIAIQRAEMWGKRAEVANSTRMLVGLMEEERAKWDKK